MAETTHECSRAAPYPGTYQLWPVVARERQRALQLAAEQAARVTLLHVLPASPDWNSTTGMDALGLLHSVLELSDESLPIPCRSPGEATERRRALERLLRKIHPKWRDAISIEIVRRQGKVLEQILEHARSESEQVNAIVL